MDSTIESNKRKFIVLLFSSAEGLWNRVCTDRCERSWIKNSAHTLYFQVTTTRKYKNILFPGEIGDYLLRNLIDCLVSRLTHRFYPFEVRVFPQVLRHKVSRAAGKAYTGRETGFRSQPCVRRLTNTSLVSDSLRIYRSGRIDVRPISDPSSLRLAQATRIVTRAIRSTRTAGISRAGRSFARSSENSVCVPSLMECTYVNARSCA